MSRLRERRGAIPLLVALVVVIAVALIVVGIAAAIPDPSRYPVHQPR
jgi:Tfp pilus assembly protein PilX